MSNTLVNLLDGIALVGIGLVSVFMTCFVVFAAVSLIIETYQQTYHPKKPRRETWMKKFWDGFNL